MPTTEELTRELREKGRTPEERAALVAAWQRDGIIDGETAVGLLAFAADEGPHFDERVLYGATASQALEHILRRGEARETRTMCSACGEWHGVASLAAISAGTALCRRCAGERRVRGAQPYELAAFAGDVRELGARLLSAQAARIDELETAWGELEASALTHGLVLGSDGSLRKLREEAPAGSARYVVARDALDEVGRHG